MKLSSLSKLLPVLIGLVTNLFLRRKTPARRAEDVLPETSYTEAAKAKAAAAADKKFK